MTNNFEVAAVDVETIPNGPAGHGTHAMVLDTIHENKFIFKNTYAENRQVKIPVHKGPLEFYFVHMELNEEGNKELKSRQARIEAAEPEPDTCCVLL